MPSANLKRLRWYAAIYVALIVLTVCLADDGDYTFVFAWVRAIPGADKPGHFLLMGMLSFVVNLSLGLRTVLLANRRWLLGSFLVGTIVMLEEISQAWIPTRTFDLLDLTFDFLGICCFGWLARRMFASFQPKSAVCAAKAP